MKRRSFLAAIAALPVFGLAQKTPARDFSKFTNYPVNLTEPVALDPFIEINLDHGPVTINGINFSVSDLMPVRLTYGLGSVSPTETLIEKLRDILKNDGGTVSLLWGPDIEFCDYVRVSYGESFEHIIPLENTAFDKGEFYTKVTKNTSDQRLEFYHIIYRGKNNLFVRTFEPPRRDDLFISQEAVEEILNCTQRS